MPSVRYLTWSWATRVHVEAPALAAEVGGAPRLPTSAEVWDSVLGGTVSMWCGVTVHRRQPGERARVVEVEDAPDPATVCKNCTAAIAKGKPRPPREPQHGDLRKGRGDSPEPARPAPAPPVRRTGATGGRYVWRGGRKSGGAR